MRIDFITRNGLLKLLSLGISVILWFFVVSSKRAETVIEVPLRFVNTPPTLEIVDAEEKLISIRLEGQERVLNGLNVDDVYLVIDLSRYKEGRVSYHLSEENVRLPHSLTVKNIYPSKISFTLKRSKEKGKEGDWS